MTPGVRASPSICVRDRARRGETAMPVRAQPTSPARRETPNPSCQRTCSTIRLPCGNGRSSLLSGRVKSSHALQSVRSKTTTWRLWIGAISGPGSVVRSVKLSGTSPCAGRHNPAKQNQSFPALVNRHFDFGDFVPVNSKKCEAGTRHRPLEKRRPSDLKLITGGAFARSGRKPHRSCASSTPLAWRRTMGATSVGQMSSRGSRLGAAMGSISGRRRWLNSST